MPEAASPSLAEAAWAQAGAAEAKRAAVNWRLIIEKHPR
jgi:hypothetical protein